MGVKQDDAAPRDHLGCQHVAAERIRPIVGQEQFQLRFVRQTFHDVGDDLDELRTCVHVGGDGFDLGDEPIEGDFSDGGEEFFDTREIAVDGPAGDAERVRHVGQRGFRGASVVDDLQRRIDDPLARLGVVGGRCARPALASHEALTLSHSSGIGRTTCARAVQPRLALQK